MKKIFIFVVTFIFGLQTTIVYSQNLKVDFTWQLKHSCSKVLPEIKVEGIPAGTIELNIRMVDLDMRTFNHGGGLVKNDTGFSDKYTVAEGALKSYDGPCPPNFSSFGHDYEFTVIARDKENKKVAEGERKKTFSAKEVKQ